MGFMDQLKEQFSFSELTGLYQSYKSGELDVDKILNDTFMQKYTDFGKCGSIDDKTRHSR